MSSITDLDLWNKEAYDHITDNIEVHYICKMCGGLVPAINMGPVSGSHYEGYNFVCNNCITKMTTIFQLDKNDLDDIITNAGEDLKKQHEIYGGN